MPPSASPIDFNNPLLWIVIAWTLAWKGYALWIAARKGSKPWYIALLILNTLGILEILYIYVFSRAKKSPPAVPSGTNPPASL